MTAMFVLWCAGSVFLAPLVGRVIRSGNARAEDGVASGRRSVRMARRAVA